MANNDGDVIGVSVVHNDAATGNQVNSYQLQLETATAVSNADLLDDIEEWVQTFYNLVKTIISIRSLLQEVVVRNITQGLLVGSTLGGTYTGGTAAGDCAPQGCCSLAYFKTDVPRVILRKFLPPPATSSLAASGSLGSTSVTTLAGYASALLNTQYINGRGYSYGYLSPKTLTFVKPTVSVTPSAVAYQRRRKFGVGS